MAKDHLGEKYLKMSEERRFENIKQNIKKLNKEIKKLILEIEKFENENLKKKAERVETEKEIKVRLGFLSIKLLKKIITLYEQKQKLKSVDYDTGSKNSYKSSSKKKYNEGTWSSI